MLDLVASAAVHFEHALQGGPRPWRMRGRHDTLPTRRFANWSVRSGACGTGAGRDAGASSRRCAAGARRKHVRDVAGIGRFLRARVHDLLGYLARNEGALVHYADPT